MISEHIIKKIEEVFGFELYHWQKDYLLGNEYSCPHERCSGKTFIYCIELLLSDGDPIPWRELELIKYADEYHDTRYKYWFAGYFFEINKKLVSAGFKTRISENKNQKGRK